MPLVPWRRRACPCLDPMRRARGERRVLRRGPDHDRRGADPRTRRRHRLWGAADARVLDREADDRRRVPRVTHRVLGALALCRQQ